MLSCAHFEGTLSKKNILYRNCVLPGFKDIRHRCRRVKSCLKREIWPLDFDMLPCNPKIGVHFFHLVLWGHFLLALCLIGLCTCCLTPHILSDFPFMCLIWLTQSVVSAGDMSISFIFWVSAPYDLSGARYGWYCGFFGVLWLNCCRDSFAFKGIDMSKYCFYSPI